MSVFKVFRHQIELLSRIGNSCDINQIFFYEHPHRRISMHLDMKHRESDVSYNIFAHEVHRGNQSLLSVMISCGIFPETSNNLGKSQPRIAKTLFTTVKPIKQWSYLLGFGMRPISDNVYALSNNTCSFASGLT